MQEGPQQIDLYGSRGRLIGFIVLACGLVALCAWIVYAHPTTGSRSAEPGSFAEFVAIIGVVFFGFVGLVAAARLFRVGPTLSIGVTGVFDRRLSTDWIAWDAIEGVGFAETGQQRWAVLRVDAAREASLPIRRSARWLATLNRGMLGPNCYSIGASDLRGGFPALKAAFDRAGDPADTGAR